MAWYWYIAVFLGSVFSAMVVLGWLSGLNNDVITTAEEDDEIRKRYIAWSHLITIGLLLVIVVFLFVEMK